MNYPPLVLGPDLFSKPDTYHPSRQDREIYEALQGGFNHTFKQKWNAYDRLHSPPILKKKRYGSPTQRNAEICAELTELYHQFVAAHYSNIRSYMLLEVDRFRYRIPGDPNALLNQTPNLRMKYFIRWKYDLKELPPGLAGNMSQIVIANDEASGLDLQTYYGMAGYKLKQLKIPPYTPEFEARLKKFFPHAEDFYAGKPMSEEWLREMVRQVNFILADQKAAKSKGIHKKPEKSLGATLLNLIYPSAQAATGIMENQQNHFNQHQPVPPQLDQNLSHHKFMNEPTVLWTLQTMESHIFRSESQGSDPIWPIIHAMARIAGEQIEFSPNAVPEALRPKKKTNPTLEEVYEWLGVISNQKGSKIILQNKVHSFFGQFPKNWQSSLHGETIVPKGYFIKKIAEYYYQKAEYWPLVLAANPQMEIIEQGRDKGVRSKTMLFAKIPVQYKPKYFVIHSTDTEVGKTTLIKWKELGIQGKGHAYIQTDGTIIIVVDFHLITFATRQELHNKQGLGEMIHIELNYNSDNGPTEAQYHAVAHLYKKLSATLGTLVIVSHLEVDRGIKGAHSDPAKFNFDRLKNLLITENIQPIIQSQERMQVPNQADMINSWPPRLQGSIDRKH